MADKDEILLNFQAITGIEDIGTCFDILEQKNWDMMVAANSVMHQQDSFPPASSSSSSSRHSAVVSSGNGVSRAQAVVDLTNDQPVSTATAYDSVRQEDSVPQCSLGVYFRNQRISIELPTHSTIAQVKERLREAMGMHPDLQLITGWPADVTDQMRLSELPLPEGVYHLKLEERPPPSSSFPLLPLLRRRASRTPSPPASSSSSHASSQYSDAHDMLSSAEEEEEEEEDEFAEPLESLDDSMFSVEPAEDPAVAAMREPLVVRECTQPTETLQVFTQQFERRYGPMHPLFFIGSLEDAVREATGPSPISGQRKPIFIYIHHDSSVLSNVFCSQLLCNDSVVNYLSMNFITWAWDVTFQEHRIKLLQMVDESFGRLAKTNVEDIKPDHLPVILVVYKTKGALGIRNIIQGTHALSTFFRQKPWTTVHGFDLITPHWKVL